VSWRDHPLCARLETMPSRFWGPEHIDPDAWEEFASRLRIDAELSLLSDCLAGASSVLDVGSGSGLLSAALSPKLTRFVAVEPNPIIGERLGVALAHRGALARARAEGLPFASGVFDAVVSTWVLQYTDDPWLSVREMARVCSRREGSRIVLVQAAPDNDLVALYNACAGALGEPTAHHGFLLAGAADILGACGFGDVTLRRCSIPMDFGDVPESARPATIASLVRRLHHSHAAPEAVEPAIKAVAAALLTDRAGVLRDDGVFLIGRVSG
jgi:SAM-dependent methyltransferase